MLFSIATAHARPVDERELASIVEQLRPRVEQVAGRTFDTLPRSAIDDRAHVRSILTERPPWATAEDWTAEDAARAGREADELLGRALAIYSPNRDTLYLLSDALRSAFQSLDADSDLVRPIVQCVVAHELTHALQYRSVAGPWLLATDDVRTRLGIEGHASWVEAQVCPAAGRAADAALSGRDLVGSLDRADPYVYTYIVGAEFAAAYVQRFGTDAWWWRLDEAAPPREAVDAIADARLVKRWRDPGPIVDALRAIPGLERGVIDVEPYPPYAFLRQLAGGGHQVQVPDVHPTAAMRAEVLGGGDAAASVHAWLLGSEAEAAAIVAMRRSQIGWGFRGLATVSPVPIVFKTPIFTRLLPARSRPSGVTDSLWATAIVAGGGVYQEAWVARGRVALLLGWRGRHRDRDLLDALARLTSLPLDTEPVGVEHDPAAMAALEALGPPAEMPAPTRSALWVASHLDRTDPRRCAAEANAGLTQVGSSGRSRLAVAGILCAEQAGDAAAIRAVAAQSAEDGVLAAAASSLASLQDFAGAAAVARGITSARPELWAIRRGAELMDAARRRDWNAVRGAVDDPAIPETARGVAATFLWNAGKQDEARRVLRALCLARAPGETPAWCALISGL